MKSSIHPRKRRPHPLCARAMRIRGHFGGKPPQQRLWKSVDDPDVLASPQFKNKKLRKPRTALSPNAVRDKGQHGLEIHKPEMEDRRKLASPPPIIYVSMHGDPRHARLSQSRQHQRSSPFILKLCPSIDSAACVKQGCLHSGKDANAWPCLYVLTTPALLHVPCKCHFSIYE
eukprot:1143399-Pelagomonas_calceolata.AAC.2